MSPERVWSVQIYAERQIVASTVLLHCYSVLKDALNWSLNKSQNTSLLKTIV